MVGNIPTELNSDDTQDIPKKTLSFLSDQVELSIKKIKPKVRGNKNKTSLLNLTAVSLSALITLTLALEIKDADVYQKNFALILGAVLTVINGWTLLFNYKKLWIRQKKTLLSLYQIKNEIGYLCTKTDNTDKDIETLFERYLELWERDSTEWINIHKPSPKKTNQQ